MSATSVIRVNPVSIQEYANKATQLFGEARTQLERLVQEAVEVRYYGPNAVQFKTTCGEMAWNYSTALLNDFVQIADAVRGVTSNIADSLGGAPINIAVNGTPVARPTVPQGDGTFDVDVSELEKLRTSVTAHVAAVIGALDSHLQALQGTDWQGTAKASATGAVESFTKLARGKAEEAGKEIDTFIANQIQSVVAADQ